MNMRMMRNGLCVALILAGGGVAALPQVVDPIISDEILVRLRPGVDVADFNARHGTATLAAIASRNLFNLVIPPELDPAAVKTAAENDADSLWVEFNYAGQLAESRGRCFYGVPTPDMAAFLNDAAFAQIGVDAAQSSTTGAGITVAIVDTGIDATHSLLAPVVLPGGWNFVDQTANTADVGNGLDDDGDGAIDEFTGHGTHVAGIVWRVAPDAGLLPVKVANSDGRSDNFLVAAGIFYAIDAGVDVINVSIGSTYNSDAVADAVAEAAAAGIVVVASGGNVDTRTPVEYPALNAGAIGVASVDNNDVKAYFSNYHENLVISAPGVQIHSTFPGEQYVAWDGTSMSTPMVAAAAALVLSRHPQWSPDAARANNVRLAITRSAVDVDPLNPGFEGLLGAGRLDVAAAITAEEALSAAIDYDAGPGPVAVAAADLDHDGAPDLVVANAVADEVGVLLNLGGGAFGAVQHYAVGSLPLAVAVADLDGDGNADIVAACGGDATVHVLAGAGDGTFSAGGSFAAGNQPRSVAVAQLAGDELPDVAVADEEGDAVRVLRNTGGDLALHATIPVGRKPYDLAAIDVDGDNDVDLVAISRDTSSLWVIRNLGAGAFASATPYPVGQDPRAMTAGDLDGDGDADVVTANHDSGNMTIAWNDGGGGFGETSTVALAGQLRPRGLAIADIDCDGLADLIATSDELGVGRVSVLGGRGDHAFYASVDYPVAAGASAVVAASIDGDADADLVVAAASAGAVSVLVNRGCEDRRGDCDCDGDVDFFDIDPFLVALGGQAAYAARYPDCDWLNADCDGDGDVDFFDIDAFLERLGR